MNEKTSGTAIAGYVIAGLGMLMCIGVIIKMSFIGYYDNELTVLIVAMLAGLAMAWGGLKLSKV